MYDFFTLYADVDKWEWDGKLDDPMPELTNPLDKWIVSRLHQLTGEVESHMDRYDLPNALKPILPFIDDASNWYVRRSRKRFWKSDNDQDKDDAYRTLHYVLVRLSMVMAPFTPFLSEELYRKLTGGESVHLLDWPAAGHINELLINQMAAVRQVITEGLAERAKNSIKVRQPLASVTVSPKDYELTSEYQDIVLEELNVKDIKSAKLHEGQVVQLDTKITPELAREGLLREIIRQVQQARKAAGLQVDDRIALGLVSDNKTVQAVIDDDELLKELKHETLTDRFSGTEISNPLYKDTVKVDGHELTLYIKK
jgi:isoleucyl-tRNA synthetase